MLIKFLAHGTGSARRAADYLLGERDAAGKPRGCQGPAGGSEPSCRRGRHAGVRAQVHVRRDRVGAGGRADRRTDRRGSGRVRGDGLGRARTRPLRLGRRAPPRGGRRRARPCPRRPMRPRNRAESEHRPSRLGEDVRPAPGRLQPRTRLGSSGRSDASQSAAAGTPRIRRGHPSAGRAPARILTPRPDPGLPATASRARNGAESPRGRRSPAGGGPRSAAPRHGLHHRAGPRDRGPVAAERRTVWRELRARTI